MLRQEAHRDGKKHLPATEQFWLIWHEDYWYFCLDCDVALAFLNTKNIELNIPFCGRDPSGNQYSYNAPTGLCLRLMPMTSKSKVAATISVMSGSHAWGVPLHLVSDDAGDVADTALAIEEGENAEATKEEDADEENDKDEEVKERARKTRNRQSRTLMVSARARKSSVTLAR